ncbi:hypothetical protein [Geomicrobium sediminis]|uniref:Uncharacterized protein n=1 Tax=Geomicrobium sediminis TaxID=1347788 RepID=A0ABS2PFB3_9BACL|nr:hypothetical protein [Geomicrobium sediminis]MBM7634104.1 hypothetical protein [Geomicrobium sediminis]
MAILISVTLGAFLTFGLLLALRNALRSRTVPKHKKSSLATLLLPILTFGFIGPVMLLSVWLFGLDEDAPSSQRPLQHDTQASNNSLFSNDSAYSEEVASRFTPAEAGETVRVITAHSLYGELTTEITLLSVERGDRAFQRILDKDRDFTLHEDMELLLAHVHIYTEDIENKELFTISPDYFQMVTSTGKTHQPVDLSLAQPLWHEMEADTNANGWIAFLINKDDSHPSLVYMPDYDGPWHSLSE